MQTRCFGCMQTFDDQYQICPHCGYAVGTPAEYATGTVISVPELGLYCERGWKCE